MNLQAKHRPSDDWIHLDGMTFYAFHGVDPAEKQLGQRFVVDLSVSLDLRKAGATDDLRDTVNYAELYRLTRNIVEGPSCHLLEAVAAQIAESVLQNTLVTAVRVILRKPEVPIKGSILSAASVEITRSDKSSSTSAPNIELPEGQ